MTIPLPVKVSMHTHTHSKYPTKILNLWNYVMKNISQVLKAQEPKVSISIWKSKNGCKEGG